MYAHFFSSKTGKFVIISTSMRPTGEKLKVESKAEAKKIAKERNAKPWNF